MYAARRAVILADGKSKPQHLDDRHFMEVGGEPLIVRTIRQFKGFCEDVTVICPKDFFDELPWIQGVYHALGRGMEWAFFGADMIRKGLELCIDPRTIIVFGDVYFTDEAIDIIREGNGLARRFLRVLDRAAPGEEIATARVVVRTIFHVADQADTLLRGRYQALGSPYGETEEGLQRWVAERQENERMRRDRLN